MLTRDPDDDSAVFCYSDISYSILAALIHGDG